MQSLTSQIFGVVSPLGENLALFSHLAFDGRTNSDHKTQKIKLCSVRALKRYLNQKNLIHGQVTATIKNLVRRLFKRILD